MPLPDKPEEKKEINQRDNVPLNNRGNSAAHLAARIKKKRPDIADDVEAGKYPRCGRRPLCDSGFNQEGIPQEVREGIQRATASS